MKTTIVVFPGTNREHDMAQAIERASGQSPKIVWHKDTDLGNPDLIVLPGGFSYGDYLRCGAMAAQSPVMKEIINQAKRGVNVLGVCNGFQILVESGLLPGALLRNASLKFICKQVHLKTGTAQSPFTRNMKAGDIITVPVAHGEGNYFAPADTVKEMEDGDRIAFRYCNADGTVTEAANPNGAVGNIAGILNKDRNVLGLMPHPENATQDHQGNISGLPVFESLVAAL
ncbi:MAG: phosphoribosylformylglycinamidine synthase I [Micavibrio sp.]